MIRHSKILLVFLLIIALIIIGYFYRQMTLTRKIRTSYEAIVKKVAELQKENELLENQIDKMENEKELERLARELYVLKKADEKAMVIPQEIMEKLQKSEIETTDAGSSKNLKWMLEEIKEFFRDLF